MNIVRHELGFSTKTALSAQRHLPGRIYSAVVNTQCELAQVLQSAFLIVAEWETELKALFLGYVEAKQAQQVLDYDDLLLYWAQMVGEAQIAAEVGARFSHVLVDRCGTPTICKPRCSLP